MVHQSAAGSYAILVAEDDEDDRSLLEQAFEMLQEPVRIVFAPDGPGLLQQLEAMEDAALPALIVLDYNMPGLTGLEVLQRLSLLPRYDTIPRVMYSSSASERFRRACLDARAEGYIEKGIGLEGLMEDIRQMLTFCNHN